MKHHLNTLFVTTQGAYLRKDGEAVTVRVERENRLRIPLHNLGGIVCFGRVSCSPPLLGACGQSGIHVAFLTEHGRFLACVRGFTPGNVLLRREQYRRADDCEAAADIARSCIVGKLANYRTVLRRAAREARPDGRASALDAAADRMDHGLHTLSRPNALDTIRGIEGECSAAYFRAFNHLIVATDAGMHFSTRSRRPPMDPVNAVLSFLYALLANDARSACEAAGLDPAVGFLHRDRPGRAGLALDLMEEFRPVLADRLALSLINRQQIKASGFQTQESGAVLMDEKTRKLVITRYQQRKQESLVHPFLGDKVSLGLVIHLQARLMARYLRGDLDAYPPFTWR